VGALLFLRTRSEELVEGEPGVDRRSSAAGARRMSSLRFGIGDHPVGDPDLGGESALRVAPLPSEEDSVSPA
jgi:hypothetical protein